jgi:hypothetical protein
MSKIQIKFDNNLKQSKIAVPLATPTPDELKSVDTFTQNKLNVRQTLIYGLAVPLVKIGDIVIDKDDVLYMRLDGSKTFPKLELIVLDTQHTIKGLQQPSSQSEVRLQILPRLENAYKKIDLTFYIKSCDMDGDEIHLMCIYKVLDLYKTQIKCFGEITSYELFETIAHECQLGFASNIAGSMDKRYIYCANQSYEDIMNRSIATSGDSENTIKSRLLYDYWIDFWNNITFADVYERFNSVDKDEDMMIYVAPDQINIAQDSIDEDMFFRTPAVLSNDPAHEGTELFIPHYNVTNRSKVQENGSDRIITIYSDEGREPLDYLIQDGDQHDDVFRKSEYSGECPREFNYLLASSCRSMLEDKMKGETIEVEVRSPLLQLPRGSKVNLKWYDTSAILARKKQGLGIKDTDISTNIQIDPQEGADTNPNPLYRINKQVSGQYYILSSVITYEGGEWSNMLELTRPRDKKEEMLDLSEATAKI